MTRIATSLLVLTPVLLSCAAPEATAPPADPAPTVESAALGLRLAALPEGVRPASSEGDRLVLDAVSDGVPGNLALTVGPPIPAGINLVEEANGFGRAAEQGGGEFFGGHQIVTPWGSGYVVRVLIPGRATEEIRAFLVHPIDPDRLLTAALRYPPGEPEVSRARMSQLLELLGEIEPIAPPAGGG